MLGDIVKKKISKITDHEQIQVETIETIQINSVIPCPQISYFYDAVGRVNCQKLKDFLGSQYNKVVSWYIYKTGEDIHFTFRDKLVHKSLTNIFNVYASCFTTCLLTKATSENSSTHSFETTFWKHSGMKYTQIPIHISNLGEKNNAYKSEGPSSQTFQNIIKQLNVGEMKSNAILNINKIHSALLTHVNEVAIELSVAEKRLFDLENEIAQLKNDNKNKVSSENMCNTFKEIIEKDKTEIDASPSRRGRRRVRLPTSPKVEQAIPSKRGRGRSKKD